MAPQIVALVLFAAVLHASWNTLLRGGSDRLWSMAIMCVAIALVCAPVAAIIAAPARASWPYAAASGLLHVGYNLFLVRTYRSGDLGQTYPIARGSSPLLVTLGAAVFAGEIPNALGLIGVALVSCGILSLALPGRAANDNRLRPATLASALTTGCFIGAYSVTDGIGVRLSGAPISYTVWMCLAWSVALPVGYIVLRGWRSLHRGRRETLVAAGGGLISLAAYGIVTFAMSRSPMGPVSALRETSVVFAAILGGLFLHERLTRQRLVACVIIAFGAACLG